MNVRTALPLIAALLLSAIRGRWTIERDFGTENLTSPTWSEVNAAYQSAVDRFLSPSLLVKLESMGRKIGLSNDCRGSLFQTITGVRNYKKWALEMLDATGKPPGGILEGTVMSFGSFDECLRIRVNGTSGESFRGRYCMMGIKSPLVAPLSSRTPDGRTYVQAYGEPPEWIAEVIERADRYLKRTAFWYGVCIPSTCADDDLVRLAKVVAKPLGADVSVADCQVDEVVEWPTYSKVAAYVISCLLGLSALGTAMDIFLRFRNQMTDEVFVTQEHWTLRALKAFSAYGNTEKLFRTDDRANPLDFFNGVRFLSSTWIVLGHTYFFTDTWKYLKFRRLMGMTVEFDRHLPAAIMENFTIPVSSFFFMSGFLIMYTNWRKLEGSGGRLNVFMFFVHKYWRMTPALAVTIVLFMAMPVMDSGPLWHSTLGPPIESCRKLWWTDLLYISNWWNSDQYCLLHTWYLSALMQFHLVAVFLLLLFFKWPVLATMIGSIILIGSSVMTALITLLHDFPMPAPGMVKDMDVIAEYNSVIYIKPFAHIAAYLIGMVAGYLVLRFRKLKLRWMHQVAGWTLATLFSVSAVYGLYGPDEPAVLRALYLGGHRIGWALGIAWLTFACATGQGGLVQRILSWKAFAPLGQLSYLAYLVHPLIIMYRNAAVRERVYYGHTELVYSFLAHTIVSFFIAYLCYVIVEMPFSTLEAMVFRKSSIQIKSNQKEIIGDHGNICTKSVKTIIP